MSGLDDVIASIPKGLFIGGEWREASDKRTFAVEDPSTGELICRVSDASVEDGLDAVRAATDAFTSWSRTSSRYRSQVLRRAYDLIIDRVDTLSQVMSLETGKPLAQSRGEWLSAADFILWYSEEAVRTDGRAGQTPESGALMLVLKEPVGPCLMLPTWNYPGVTPARKLAPALAAGCTAIIKVHERAPLSGLAIVQAFIDAGVPSGVINVVPTQRGVEVVPAIIADQRVRKISMTGSTAVGKLVTAMAAQNMQRVSMELGGNAAFIVFPDADLDQAIESAVFSKGRSSGATCTAGNRFFVHESMADDFAIRLAGRFDEMRIGPGLDPESEFGPLIASSEVEKVETLLEDAVSRGAKVLCGGTRLEGHGHFFPPTVLTNVDARARVVQEEIFGPLVPVLSFSDEEEVIELANDTSFGLASYVFTSDLNQAMRVSERLETGMVGINHMTLGRASSPFGGTKWSGVGREGGPEGIEEYLNLKHVAIGRSA